MKNETVKPGDRLCHPIYYGDDIILDLVQEAKGIPKLTVIISEGHYLGVKVENNSIYWADPHMYQRNYANLFNENTRVISLYLKKGAGSLRYAAEDLADYLNFVCADNCPVLLIGHSKAGLLMYECAPHVTNRKVFVMTISSPFGGTIMGSKAAFKASKKKLAWILNHVHASICSEHLGDLDIVPKSEFLLNLKPLPENVRHYAFVGVIGQKLKGSKNLVDIGLKMVDKLCALNGDGVVSKESQMSFPRKPDAIGYVNVSHNQSLMEVCNTHLNAMMAVIDSHIQ